MTRLSFGIVLAAGWAWHPGALVSGQQADPAKTNKMITVSVVSSENPIPFGGPAPAVVSLVNPGSEAASVLLSYPNPNYLRFECSAKDFAEPKEVEAGSDRVAPTVIPPGGTYSATYFLNRYLRFLKPGSTEIRYRLDMVVNNKDESFDGVFSIRLAAVSEAELRDRLRSYARGLHSNRQAKLEAAEALAYLETPLAVKYLIEMLGIDNLEITAIHSLEGRHSEEVALAIASMLSHPDSSVVEAALEAIDRDSIPIPRSAVQRLLSSVNANTQWVALGWLGKHPSRDDLPLLGRLENSPTAAVRERAVEYGRVLRTK